MHPSEARINHSDLPESSYAHIARLAQEAKPYIQEQINTFLEHRKPVLVSRMPEQEFEKYKLLQGEIFNYITGNANYQTFFGEGKLKSILNEFESWLQDESSQSKI